MCHLNKFPRRSVTIFNYFKYIYQVPSSRSLFIPLKPLINGIWSTICDIANPQLRQRYIYITVKCKNDTLFRLYQNKQIIFKHGDQNFIIQKMPKIIFKNCKLSVRYSDGVYNTFRAITGLIQVGNDHFYRDEEVIFHSRHPVSVVPWLGR